MMLSQRRFLTVTSTRRLGRERSPILAGDQNAAKSLYCRYRAEHLASVAQRQAKQIRTAEAKHHGTQLLWGILALIAGVGITSMSYATTDPGGHYLVASGLMVGGFVYTCRGLAGLAKAGIGGIRPSK